MPLYEINTDIPQPLSDIVLKLLAKNPDERYLSAQGLGADLVRCLDQLQRTGTVESFELGQGDFSDRLRIPQKHY